MLRFVLVTLLCGLLVAQQAPPPSPPQAKPQEPAADEVTFRGGVDVVSTPALVFDTRVNTAPSRVVATHSTLPGAGAGRSYPNQDNPGITTSLTSRSAPHS